MKKFTVKTAKKVLLATNDIAAARIVMANNRNSHIAYSKQAIEEYEAIENGPLELLTCNELYLLETADNKVMMENDALEKEIGIMEIIGELEIITSKFFTETPRNNH